MLAFAGQNPAQPVHDLPLRRRTHLSSACREADAAATRISTPGPLLRRLKGSMGGIFEDGDAAHGRIVVAAVLLAAGAGSRLGGRPKCLLELDGMALIRRQLTALLHAGVNTVCVVLGHHAALIEPALAGFPVTGVRNPQPDDGQVSSQRLGLAALGSRHDAVLVALADQPLIEAQDIAALIGAFEKRPAGAAVVYPQVQGKRGNPVMFTAAVREEILAGPAEFGCRQWQAANAAAVAPYVTDNPRYKVDIDTDADLEAFTRNTGLVLRWPAALTRA